MRFFLDMVPPTKTHHDKAVILRQATRIDADGKPYVKKWHSLRDKDDLKLVVQEYELRLLAFRPKKPLEGPLRLHYTFVFPFKKGDDINGPPVWHTDKPDADNLAKTPTDAMTRVGFFSQDSRVVALSVLKFRAQRTGVLVHLTSLRRDPHALNDPDSETLDLAFVSSA